MWRHADHPAIRVVPARGFAAIFRQFHVDVLWTRCIWSAFSCVRTLCCLGVPWHHVWCHGAAHAPVTWPFAMKGLPMPRLGLLALGLWFVRSSGLPLPPAYGWCLTRVGRDASSTSLGWSLLPSSVIIVLALVNSTVSPEGDLGISTRPGSVASLPVSTASTGLLCLSVGACVHRCRSVTEVEHVAATAHISHSVRDNSWHPWVGAGWWHAAQIVGEDSPRLWPESSSVDCGNFREGQYTLVPEGFPPGSLYACTGWRGVCNDTSRRKGWIGIITTSHCALL